MQQILRGTGRLTWRRLEHQDVPHLIEVLKRLIPRLNDEELVGKLWIVNERTIRIRG